ncbi:MAG: hypothetical protein KatS3mg113_0968 [Planctomycetaceae bacterium]|nr:MAG: hypothetical protein KatS3mg113_0968 [Planctomycetaceae bacterium]
MNDDIPQVHLTDGIAQLQQAAEKLFRVWEQMGDVWKDAQRERLQREYIEPLQQALSLALTAANQMDQTLRQAQRCCCDQDALR